MRFAGRNVYSRLALIVIPINGLHLMKAATDPSWVLYKCENA